MKIRGLETIFLKVPFSLGNMQKIFSHKYTILLHYACT